MLSCFLLNQIRFLGWPNPILPDTNIVFESMATISIIAQFFLCLSILIVLHEGGHYLAARMTGTRVDKFYLFFDFLFPFPDKMNFSLWKKKIGDTEYGIGWFPMGGYVAIAGMQDETQDAPDPNREPLPDEYMAKSKLQKLFIMLGGVIVNFILGFLIYAMVLWVWGEEKLPTDNAKYGIYADELGQELGFKDGDTVLKVGNVTMDYLDRGVLKRQLTVKQQDEITVKRDGKTMTFKVDETAKKKIMTYKARKSQLIGPRFPFVLHEITAKSPADESDLMVGDRIVSVNDTSTVYFQDFARKAKHYKDTEITIGYQRGEQDTVLFTKVTLDKDGKMGVVSVAANEILEFETIEYGLGEAMPAGFHDGMEFIKDQFAAFGMMFSGDLKVTESLGGFGSIGGLFDPKWDWHKFWIITGMLSLILAIMNLLPIPLLDGGYVMFLLIEMVTGREIPERIMNVLLNIGLYLILGLMIFANGMDILRFIGLA